MYRWLVLLLLIIDIVVLIGSAGDAFLVHHHINGLSVDEHYPALAATAIIYSFILLYREYKNALFLLSNRDHSLLCQAIARCFCGWHSSAYLEKIDTHSIF